MKRFPNALVIILATIALSWILTYVVPQGSYERLTELETQKTSVVPGSYAQLDVDHLPLFDMLLAIPRGIIGQGDTVILILLLGGCFYVIEKTGALAQGLNQLVSLLDGREVLALVFISLLFMSGGVMIGMQEEVIAMTPVLLLFGRNLGYNALTVVYISYGSTVVGSAFSPFNPFAVIIAQKEADLELLSGSSFRVIVLLIAAVAWIAFIIRYANRNKVEKVIETESVEMLNGRSTIIVALLVCTFVFVTYGLLRLDWGFNEISASFFGLGIISGWVGGLGINKTTEYYIDGFKEMIFAAMIVGLAHSISLILTEGRIIDTIVHGLFGPLENLPPAASGVLMMVAHSVLHFPIPSYSGQVVLTMPVLVPLSDLIGLSRQVCVLAYQYGAVMMDMIVPTNGALMAVLAISSIPYDQWLKFVAKATLLIMIIAGIAVVVAVAIGYN